MCWYLYPWHSLRYRTVKEKLNHVSGRLVDNNKEKAAKEQLTSLDLKNKRNEKYSAKFINEELKSN